ncbi:MAG: arginine--tRNA ligase [Caldilineaceae bacterium]|nr:arginine--tRNA ligase [Caldilineaceae bacterium]
MIRDQIQAAIAEAMAAAQADGQLPPFDLPAIEVLRPKQAEHGDYSTNVAMVAAAAVRKSGGSANPRAIAEAIASHVPADGPIGQVDIAGPGFINIRLADGWLQQQVAAIVAAGGEFGNIARGHGQRWQVEFVSANPTGPIHYGGARNAALGDALANVLAAAGYDVQREFYVNDAGTQFELFIATLYARYAQLFGRDEPVPVDGYAGEYMVDYAKKIAARFGERFLAMPKAQALTELREIGEDIVLTALQQELGSLGVHFDSWFREQSLYDDKLVEKALDLLRTQGDLIDKEGAVWFRATNYPKSDKDEVVIRSNGAPTYLASDIAYHYDKFIRRRFDQVINVWAVDHQGHVARMHTVMQALGLDPARLTILLYGLVKLIRDGQEVKLSKRRGNLLTIRDVVEEVGADAVRFNLLTRGPESTIEFDLDLAEQQTNDNPVFYVQYSHARICSILAKAAEVGFDTAAPIDHAELALLSHPSELALMRKLLELEEQIELAVEKLSPHNLTHYAIDLAKIFNAFYRDCHVVDPANPAQSRARLALCQATKIGLVKTLGLLGVSAPESM